eukprot:10356189-Alexandrium_andersonii.AAC.1
MEQKRQLEKNIKLEKDQAEAKERALAKKVEERKRLVKVKGAIFSSKVPASCNAVKFAGDPPNTVALNSPTEPWAIGHSIT